MFLKTFKGGIHPAYLKDLTRGKPIKRANIPDRLILPLSQHTGSPCQPLVKIGDKVKIGTKIGAIDKFISSPVHSSVSGTVVQIEKLPHPLLNRCVSVVIENDRKDEFDETIKERQDYQNLSADVIRQIILDCGIVGLGGAAFPTHVKLSPPKEKKPDAVILNGAECEPYLTGDHRLMIERSEDIIKGAQLIMKTLGVEKGYIGIEDNKPDAIEAMQKALKELSTLNSKLSTVILKTKYPQGGEKQLIKAILNREVPCGGLPFDVGVVVNNVGTALSIYEAVRFNKPLYERVVTVTGPAIKQPGNFLVRIGTPFKSILEEAGINGEIGKIVMGGPMMGIAQYTDSVPVIKGTTGILVFTKNQISEDKPIPCIRCGACIRVCPVYITPTTIAQAAAKDRFDISKDFGALDCIECGACSFICPSKIELVQLIKLAKARLPKG